MRPLAREIVFGFVASIQILATCDAFCGTTLYAPSVLCSNRLKWATTRKCFVFPPRNMLRRVNVDEVSCDRPEAIDPEALERAREILDSIRAGGEDTLIQWAIRLGDLDVGEKYWVAKDELRDAFQSLPSEQQGVLERVVGPLQMQLHDCLVSLASLTGLHAVQGDRIRRFAQAQRDSIQDMETDIPGGRAGHSVAPVNCAGCYAPGGRYPLPSSVLMTAITARVAGVKKVLVASPHPTQVTQAAAHVAGVDGLLRVGGAQAIAGMAWGTGCVPAADVVVGPGNVWVTAAKALLQGECGIDMLAGPSEVLVIADGSADAATAAADLLAQAEHDVAARPILVSESAELVEAVGEEMRRQLAALPSPNRETAEEAVRRGFAVVVGSVEEAVAVSDKIAPEHLEIMTENAMEVGRQCQHYGGLFIGQYAAEVLGDYGCGPNHVLPTGGTARYTGGLSVHNFLRVRTWMRIDEPKESIGVVNDAVALARLEGLEAHAKAAEARLRCT